MTDVTDQEVLDAVQDADVHKDFKEVVRIAIEEDMGLNMVGTLRLFIDSGSGVEEIKSKGNQVEEALAKEGVYGVRRDDKFYGAAPDSIQEELFDRVG
jgi:uncharacterized protein YabE (DUF348 family)